HATWCGPCKIIAPVFEALATKHASPGKVAFVKCDVDAAHAVAQKYGIRAMPTFIILSSGTEVDRIQGADRSSLTSAVERHVRNAKPSYSGAGHKLGAPAPTAAYIRNGSVSASVPAGRKAVGWLDTIVLFVALYLISLFSIDALGSAEKSGYAV
ncbi:thioredoxin-like protein, partial [Trichophaea hybrida]